MESAPLLFPVYLLITTLEIRQHRAVPRAGAEPEPGVKAGGCLGTCPQAEYPGCLGPARGEGGGRTLLQASSVQ